MSRVARSAVAAFVVLAVLGFLLREDPRKLGATSFGRVPSGHGALFELLVGLGLPVARSYDPPDLIPSPRTVWWIEPQALCDAPAREAGASTGEDEKEHDAPARRAVPPRLDAFVRAGGTALVFLAVRETLFRVQDLDTPVGTCVGLAGVPLPPRDLPNRREEPEDGGARPSQPEEGESSPGVLPFGGAEPEPRAAQEVDGDLVPVARRLELPRLAPFADAGSWEVRARVDGQPFVLERRIEQGRLVAIADATFLRNAWLDGADAAPLAVDFVRAFGVPWIDEYQHGLRTRERGTLALLARSPALPVFLGLAVLSLLVFWRGAALPPAAPQTPRVGSPTLEEFVGSLAGLYAQTRDHGRVAERYRELSLDRVRRSFGLAADTPREALLARLRRGGRLEESQLRDLRGPAVASTEREVRGWARRFDQIVEEACR